MRFLKSRIFAVVSGLLLSVAAVTAAYADDTEIFFNQNGSDIPANVMFILDTSGSMNDLVTTQNPYDASQTYKADQCGSSFDNSYYYFSNKGIPACGSAQKIAKAQFKCASMMTAIKSAGFATDTFVMWGSTLGTKTTGKGTVGNPSVVVSTTTYGWQRALDATNTKGYVECKADAGVDGDGADNTKLYASTDTFSIQTTTTTPPGTTVVNSDAVSAFPQRLTGIWDASKNVFKAAGSGTGANCGGSCTIYDANYLNYINDSTQTTTGSKMSIMHNAVSALMNSLTGINVGVMRYSYSGHGGMVMAPIAPIDTGTQRQDIINLVNSWAPAGVTPLSQTYYESYLYFSGNAVNYGKNSTSTTCASWNAVDGTCSGATSFSAPSVAASRMGNSLTSTKYNSPADYSCRQNFIVYLTDGLPNEDTSADSAIKP